MPSELPALQSLPKPKEMDEGVFKERLYSLSYREAEVRDVLMAFSRESSYNIIVDPEVSGKVTVDLKKVTQARALDSLVKPLGFDFKQEGRFIYIVKPKMETRMFHLNYLAVKRSGSSVVSGTGGTGASTTTTTGGTSTYSTGSQVVSQAKSEEVSNLWNEIEGRDLDGKLDDKVETGYGRCFPRRGRWRSIKWPRP